MGIRTPPDFRAPSYESPIKTVKRPRREQIRSSRGRCIVRFSSLLPAQPLQPRAVQDLDAAVAQFHQAPAGQVV